MEFPKVFLFALVNTFLCHAAVIPSGDSGEAFVELTADHAIIEALNSSTETPGLHETTTLQTEIPSAITDFAAFLKTHLNISTIQLENSEFPSNVVTAAKNGARVRVALENGISSCQPVKVRDSEGGLYTICQCSEIMIQQTGGLQRSSNEDVFVPPRIMPLGEETTSTETSAQWSESPNDSTETLATEASSQLPESSLPSETSSTEWLSEETTASTEDPVIPEETTVLTEVVAVSDESTTATKLETTEATTLFEVTITRETTMIVTNEENTAKSSAATEQTAEADSEASTVSTTAAAADVTTAVSAESVPGSSQGVAETEPENAVEDAPLIFLYESTTISETEKTETETTTVLPEAVRSVIHEDVPLSMPWRKWKRQAPADNTDDGWITLPILYIYPDVCGEDEPCCSDREGIKSVQIGTSTISITEENVSSTPKPIVTGENSVVPVVTHAPGVNAQLTAAAVRWQNDSPNFVKVSPKILIVH